MAVVNAFLKWQRDRLDIVYNGHADTRFRAKTLTSILVFFIAINSVLLLFFLTIARKHILAGQTFGGIAALSLLVGVPLAFYIPTLKGYLRVTRFAFLSFMTVICLSFVTLTGGFPASKISALMLLPLLLSFCLYGGKWSSRFAIGYTLIATAMWLTPLTLKLPSDVMINSIHVKGNGGFIFLMVMIMMGSTLKLYENANRELLRQANAATQAKSAFLANMSHEIRTPMNGVLGMAQVLQSTPMNKNQEHYVDTILSSGQSLLRILNDILDFSKLDAEKIVLENIDFDIHEELSSAISVMRSKASEKKLELILDMDKDLTRHYKGDPHRIKQVLFNLIGNAIKFTDKGYVKVSVCEELVGEAFRIKFAIQDTGVGIPADKVKRIFNRFEQSDNSTTRKYGGTGLGLAICQKIVSLMHGHISATSDLEVGSTFTFDVLLDKAATIKAKSDNFLQFDDLQNRPILIVDDLEINHAVLKEQLSTLGAKVLSVKTAKQAVSVLRKAQRSNIEIPLMISDFQMPGASGLDLVRFIKKDPDLPDTKTIILSSVDNGPYREAFRKAGVTTLLEKPVLTHDLLTAIKNTVGTGTSGRPVDENSTEKIHTLTRSRNGKVALIADDDQVNSDVLQQMLNNEGYDTVIAGNGLEACEAFKTQNFDVIFMDISMPEMNGVEATHEIRRIEALKGLSPTPVIGFTAHAMIGDRERFMDEGLDDYIAKPVAIDILHEKLRYWEDHNKLAEQAPALQAKAS